MRVYFSIILVISLLVGSIFPMMAFSNSSENELQSELQEVSVDSSDDLFLENIEDSLEQNTSDADTINPEVTNENAGDIEKTEDDDSERDKVVDDASVEVTDEDTTVPDLEEDAVNVEDLDEEKSEIIDEEEKISDTDETEEKAELEDADEETLYTDDLEEEISEVDEAETDEKDTKEDETQSTDLEASVTDLDFYADYIDDSGMQLIHIIVDDERNVTVSTWLPIEYDVMDDIDIIITFDLLDLVMEIYETDFSFELPEGWDYEIDIDNYVITIITPNFLPMPALKAFSANIPVYNVRDYAELWSLIDRINNTNPLSDTRIPDPEVTLRIVNDLEYTTAARSITRPGVKVNIVADGHNRKIKAHPVHGAILRVASSAVDVEVTISGGPEGGTLEIIGNGRFNSGTGLIAAPGGILNISDGVTVHGFPDNAVHVNGGTFNLSGTARLHNNRSNGGNGGAVRVASGGVFNMHGGILEYNTAARGGGVHVANNGSFTMTGGEIRNNFAIIDGGGLFTSSGNLGNITISQNAHFYGNIAQNGMRVDNALADLHKHNINPGTVSVPDKGLFIIDGENFAEISAHAFTNYDINTERPRYWRLSHEVREGNGTVTAKVADNGLVIPNGTFVPETLEIIFVAEQEQLFKRWEVGERSTELDEDGYKINFTYKSGGTETPLTIKLVAHTNVIGYFDVGVPVTFDPNRGLGEPHIEWILPGMYTLNHEVTHEDSLLLLGWSKTQDGSGEVYPLGTSIEIKEATTLYAQWSAATTTLTISKTVKGTMASTGNQFEFTILFMDADRNSLDMTFNYTGDVLPNTSVIAPPNGELALNDDGSAKFLLKHGQVIVIEDVPLNSYVQIIETENDIYTTTFIDSENEGATVYSINTTSLKMTENRVFSFINIREDPPPMGINLDGENKIMILLGLVLVPSLIMLAAETVYRHRINVL